MVSFPTRHVILDDQDPAIQYIGPGWTTSDGSAKATSGNGPVYGNTLHLVSNTPGSSMRLQFNGTAVAIMAPIDNAGNKTLASWQCFLDGMLFGQTSFPGYTDTHVKLCGANFLPDGPHQVEVNVTTSGPIFYVDCIIYDPSPNLSLADAVMKVDNNDQSIILSGNGWMNRYKNVWPLTSHAGDQMTFSFIGKSVTVLGVAPVELNGNQTTGTYTVDGSPPTSFLIPGHGGSTAYNQVYFTTPDFDPGLHTLVVTYEGNTDTAPFVLDWLYVANGTQTVQASPSLTTIVATTSSALVGSPEASSSSTEADRHSNSPMPIGSILGGIVGGLALIIMVFLVFLFYRRRRSRQQFTAMAPVNEPVVRPSMQNLESIITPFHPAQSALEFTQNNALHDAPVATVQQSLRPGGSAKALRKISPAPSSNHPSTAQERSSTGASASAPFPGTETTSASASGRPMSVRRVICHEDSGKRMSRAGDRLLIFRQHIRRTSSVL